MPALCRICSHSERENIDKALLAKTPRQKIADQYGIGLSSVGRHVARHLNGPLAPKQLKPWDRRPGEKLRQWNGFETYLRLCTENQDRDVTFVEVAKALGRSDKTVRSWALRYRWRERVEAWLSEIARSRLKRLRAAAERVRAQWRDTGGRMRELGTQRLGTRHPASSEDRPWRAGSRRGTPLCARRLRPGGARSRERP
jgi:Putative ATPase subunit of terminase (gpP-like)